MTTRNTPSLVAAMAKVHPDRFQVGPHSHVRAQLLHATRGMMQVSAEGGAWVVPLERALWISGGMRHEMRMAGPVALRTLYADALPDLPARHVLEVSRLLRELTFKVDFLRTAKERNRHHDNLIILSDMGWLTG